MTAYAAMLTNGYAVREGIRADIEQHVARAAPPTRTRPVEERQGAIALIPIFRAIVQRASQLGPCEVGTGTEEIGNALQMALDKNDAYGPIPVGYGCGGSAQPL